LQAGRAIRFHTLHDATRMYAMPAGGALDEETRTLIYLAAALAGSSPACVRAMADKVVQQGIPSAKVLETVHIARFAMATKIVGDAEPVFDALIGSQK
jgi:alkylhydroperoxidase/carboxymuconolactone decarboxylase family protein YurZ